MDTDSSRDTDLRPHLAVLAFIAAVAFVLSYGTLAEVASDAGHFGSWAWPVLVDAPAVVLSMAAWRAKKLEHRATVLRVLIVVLSLASAVLQALAVHPPDGQDWTLAEWSSAGAVATWPPLALLMCWETCLWLVGLKPAATVATNANTQVTAMDTGDRTRGQRPAAPAKSPAVSAGQPTPDTPPVTTPVAEPVAVGQAKVDPQSLGLAVMALREAGLDLNEDTIAERLGCSARTVRRWLAKPECAESKAAVDAAKSTVKA